MFIDKGYGVYEVHTQFLPEGRVGSLAAAKEAADYMFSNTDCKKIVTYVPEGNRGAKRLVELMGFSCDGKNGSWIYADGREVDLTWYSLTKEDFICQPPQ